jgi:hypothetical protein
MNQNISIRDFVDTYMKDEPLTYDAVTNAIKKYIYMNYEPTKQDKLVMYEKVFHTMAELLDGRQPEQVQKLLTNIRNWAKAREGSPEEEDAFESLALQNETFYNLLKTR